MFAPLERPASDKFKIIISQCSQIHNSYSYGCCVNKTNENEPMGANFLSIILY